MERKVFLWSFFLGSISFILFLFFEAQGIFGGDAGDLVTAAVLAGVPHPPGYPLYTFLGFLLSHLPFFTPAWRVGVISAFSHAAVVGFIFLIVFRLTQKILPAIFAALAILGNYLFFLYAVTPEVFALLDLFTVLLLYFLLRSYQTKRTRYLYFASFVFGLSLTHHQLVLFLLPAAGVLVYRQLSKKPLRFYLRSGLFFCLGLLPFIYIPLAGCGRALVNWDQVCSLPAFFRLITRADYGTFTSGVVYGSALLSRFLGMKAYFQILLSDFTWPGIIIAAFGLRYLLRRDRRIGGFLLLAWLISGPAFIFYASFPIYSDFNIGTFERFLLPSYLILYLFLGAGFAWITASADSLLTGSGKAAAGLVRSGIVLVLFLIPASLFSVTVYKFRGLPADRTADNLGRDILSTLPRRSILLLAHDTTLFITQYVRYGLKYRSDVAVIHASILENSSYPGLVGKNFPGLTIPLPGKNGITLPLVQANRARFPIFSNTLLPLDNGWYWVPYGLVYRLTDRAHLPTAESLEEENKKIWAKMHDPNAGILSHYDHLMLGDVRNVYADARAELARLLLKGNRIEGAAKQLTAALAYRGDTGTQNIYTLLGLSELFLNHCQPALRYFRLAQGVSPAPEKNLSLYEAVTYRDCAKDASSAGKLFAQYEKLRVQEETPLPQ